MSKAIVPAFNSTLYGLYHECLHFYAPLLEKAELPTAVSRAVQDEVKSFKRWARDTGADRPGSSDESLDSYLQGNEDVKNALQVLLRLLKLNLNFAERIILNTIEEKWFQDATLPEQLEFNSVGLRMRFAQVDSMPTKPSMETPAHERESNSILVVERIESDSLEIQVSSQHPPDNGRKYTIEDRALIIFVSLLDTSHDHIFELQRWNTANERALQKQEYNIAASQRLDEKDGVSGIAQNDEEIVKDLLNQYFPSMDEGFRQSLVNAMSLRMRKLRRARRAQYRDAPLPSPMKHHQAILTDKGKSRLHSLFGASRNLDSPSASATSIRSHRPHPLSRDSSWSKQSSITTASSSQMTVSSTMSASSSISLNNLGSSTRIVWPDRPSFPRERNSVTHCPYCYRVLDPEEIRNEESWQYAPHCVSCCPLTSSRSHVKQDLEPYNCFYKSCQTQLSLFSKERRWRDHITIYHDKSDGEQHNTAAHDHLIKNQSKTRQRHVEPFWECPFNCNDRKATPSFGNCPSRRSDLLDHVARGMLWVTLECVKESAKQQDLLKDNDNFKHTIDAGKDSITDLTRTDFGLKDDTMSTTRQYVKTHTKQRSFAAPVPNDFWVAWFCPLAVELEAARAAFTKEYEESDDYFTKHKLGSLRDQNTYYLGEMYDYPVVLCHPFDSRTGPLDARMSYESLRQAFPCIQYLFIVGIGGGVPQKNHNPDIRLGDVVVGFPMGDHPGMVQIDAGKQVNSSIPISTKVLNTPNSDLLFCVDRAVRHSEDTGSSKNHFFSTIATQLLAYLDIIPPSPDTDLCFESNYVCERRISDEQCSMLCDKRRAVKGRPDRRQGVQRIHKGLICSCGRVIKAADYRDEKVKQIAEKYQNADTLCFEMEGYAIAAEAQCLNIRGISDYCDSHKTKQWQPYAAVQAAAFAQFVMHILSQWRPWKHPLSDERTEIESLPMIEEKETRTSTNSAVLPLDAVAPLVPTSTSPTREIRVPAFYTLQSPSNDGYDSINRCKFKLYVTTPKFGAGNPESEQETYRDLKGIWKIEQSNLDTTFPSNVLTFKLDNSEKILRLWIPADGVMRTIASEFQRNPEYILEWSDCESYDVEQDRGRSWPYYCYNSSRPNLKLRIAFKDPSNAQEFSKLVLNEGLVSQNGNLIDLASGQDLEDLDERRLAFFKHSGISQGSEELQYLVATSSTAEVFVRTIYRICRLLRVTIVSLEHGMVFKITKLLGLHYGTVKLNPQSTWRYQKQSNCGEATKYWWSLHEGGSPSSDKRDSKQIPGPNSPNGLGIELSHKAFSRFWLLVMNWRICHWSTKVKLRKRQANPKVVKLLMYGCHQSLQKRHLLCYIPGQNDLWCFMQVDREWTKYRQSGKSISIPVKRAAEVQDITLDIFGNLPQKRTAISIDFESEHDCNELWRELRNDHREPGAA